MKKSELKQGVAYLVSSRGVSGYSSSVYKVAEWNRRERKYIIFSEGNVTSPHYAPSMVYVTSCPTFGAECQTHSGLNPNGFRRSCPRDKARLMDIKGEFYPLVAMIARRHRERNADGGRGERYLRHIESKKRRDREAYVKPIKEAMYEALSAVVGIKLGGYYGTDLKHLTTEQMQALTDALTVKAVN